MLWPNGTKAKPRVSSGFGPRNGGLTNFHHGTDFVGFSDIHAVAGGKVTIAGFMNPAAGNTVRVEFQTGRTHTYMHLKSISVGVGQGVVEGQKLGVMGHTGNPTGDCLHLEVRLNGNSVDPVPWVTERVGAAPAGAVAAGTGIARPRDMLTWDWTGIQRMLKSGFGYTGPIDNIPGVGTVSAFQRFQNASGFGQLVVDGDLGTQSCMAAQRWLQARWGYDGAIDGFPGVKTHNAWIRAEDGNDREFAHIV